MKVIFQNIQEHADDFGITLSDPGEYFYVFYGFGDVRKKIEVAIESEQVTAHILGLCVGTTGKCFVETVQHHKAPNSVSNLHIKSILSGDASFNYRGIINIDKSAQQSNAYQQNDNLMLSPQAHVDTKPELEIIANDVKCSHGATVGRLSEEELYYMHTRGIPKKEAYSLALNGFAQDIILAVPDENIRCELTQFVKRVLIDL